MAGKNEQKNSLTSKTEYPTMQDKVGEKKMDASATRIVKRLFDIERNIRELQREANALKKALEVAGVKPEYKTTLEMLDDNESTYAEYQPFEHSTLVDACRRILADHPGKKLTKSQIEYYAVRGGYKFSTNDSKNSVDITLRRLVADGYCEVERVRGIQGNSYWIAEGNVEAAKKQV
jgi:hypothetical protein